MIDRITANGSGSTCSIWMAETVPDYGSEVPGEAEPEVCVVGAGIAGLSVALALALQGTDVLVLDQGPIGGGQTARSSAHLASAVDEHYHVLERRFGRALARQVADAHCAAIDAIEAIARTFAPDCEFRRVDGYLFAAPGQSQRMLARELEASRRVGLACEPIERAPLPFDTGPCLRYEHQAEFHPLAYLRGVAGGIVAAGGRICTGVHVAAIHGGAPAIVELANGRRLRARAVVDATNSTISSRLDIPLREAAYRTYIVALAIERGYVPHGLYWDTDDPYHYVRVAPGLGNQEALVIGGEDHRVGQSDPAVHWPQLERWARERFPLAGPVLARWSGQVEEPADGLAYIGKNHREPGVFVITGDSGNGLTHGTIAGLLVPVLLSGADHPWAKLYAPDRTRVHGFGTLAAEAARSNAPYADWLRSGDVESLEAIAPGQGATIRRGLHVIAAYRDDAGNCHLRNARCPHLSGVVRWNEIEHTWDCPCHGSRFDPYGRVINGPAPTDLGDPPELIEHPTPVGPVLRDELAPEV
jgi:glycine/D-amino acid oxidase-like deaminating enzyme/nitrite reductase/ring-hydroxylating ferredoxin subunit